MECIECKSHSEFTCKCENCGVCHNCISIHLSRSKKPHILTEISLINSLFKCDICNSKYAKLKCLCQDEKKKFCEDCIKQHLDLNMSHCVESITHSAITRDSLKNQEKRRKLEYLAYEVRKSMEILQEFKEKVNKSKQDMLNCLEKTKAEKAEKALSCKSKLESAIKGFSYNDSHETDDLAESVLCQIDGEDLFKREKPLIVVESSINTESFLKSLKSHCKVIYSAKQAV